MKKCVIYLVSVFASLLLSSSFAAPLPNPIRFATEATYPPFEQMTANGQIRGFDIDVANALCKELQVQCVFVNQPWDSLIPSLKLGKVDALIGAMAITDERKKEVDFTNPYYVPTGSFVAAKNSNITFSADGLKGKTVGVQAGTTFIQYIPAIYGKNVKVNSYPSQENAFLDLQEGRVDLVLGDTPLVNAWIKQSGKDKFIVVGAAITDHKYLGLGDGIAVKKGSNDLLNALNKALDKIKANGTYQKILLANDFD